MISIHARWKAAKLLALDKPPQDHKARNKYVQYFFELGLNQHTIHPRTWAAMANLWLNASSSVNMFEPSKFSHVFRFALHAGRALQRLGCFVLKFRIQRAWQDLVVTLVTGLVSFVKIAELPRNQYIRVFQGGLSISGVMTGKFAKILPNSVKWSTFWRFEPKNVFRTLLSQTLGRYLWPFQGPSSPNNMYWKIVVSAIRHKAGRSGLGNCRTYVYTHSRKERAAQYMSGIWGLGSGGLGWQLRNTSPRTM
jgi:hypothetical protein